jgi:hypothetical protein
MSAPMSNVWDIPYSPKFKVGDASESKIYEAVGRALSKWEGLVADLTFIFAVLTSQDEPWHYNPAVRAFGAVQAAAPKSEMVQQAAEALFHNFEMQLNVDCDEYRAGLRLLLREYNGWSARRNDVAHGYVTESRMPDYSKDDTPITSTYLLWPSHSASRKWPVGWEPVYQYRADEIEKFGVGFDELAERVQSFGKRLEQWRIDMIRKNPL